MSRDVILRLKAKDHNHQIAPARSLDSVLAVGPPLCYGAQSYLKEKGVRDAAW